MTTNADVLTAISACTTVVADLVVQIAATANAASVNKLQGSVNALNNTVIPYLNDCNTLTKGF